MFVNSSIFVRNLHDWFSRKCCNVLSGSFIDIFKCFKVCIISCVCVAGFYCGSAGLTYPTGDCDAGFYCTLSANTSTPTDGVTGDICPAGFYCEIGSGVPIACPNGTYMNTTGASACITCPAGYYCVNRDRADICPQVYVQTSSSSMCVWMRFLESWNEF